MALFGQGEDLANRVTRAFGGTTGRIVLERVEGDHAVEDALVKLRAHVVLAEISGPRPAMWSAYRALRVARPSVPFILLTETLDEDTFVSFALYHPDDVVLSGNITRLGPAIDRALEARRSLSRLTPRQVEILVMVAEGLRTREIAERLGRSAKTVESHRGAMMKRLGLADVVSVVRFAVRMGLVLADPPDSLVMRTTMNELHPSRVLRVRSPADFGESGGASGHARGSGDYRTYQR